MKFDNLLRYAVRIINAYEGDIPLSGWLKNFYREHSQMGSTDRRQVSEMVYSFYRLGHALKNISKEDRVITGIFLTNQRKEKLLENLYPAWHELTENTLEEKLAIVRARFSDFDLLEIFPWKNLLSRGIDHRAYCLSFLEKPKLFIRVRPGKENIVLRQLAAHKISFEDADPESRLPFRSLTFSHSTKLDGVFTLNLQAVIQDLSSQQTALFLKKGDNKMSEAWDCCAGSGGKAILLSDLNPATRLTVSDIRESILNNLKKRFAEAGLKTPNFFKADLTDQHDVPKQQFPMILADLPCTGSGTWSRSPESLYFFNPQTVSNYQQRQQKILSNVLRCLKPGGILVYITCSVFAAENEAVSAFAAGLPLLDKKNEALLTGMDAGADSMYVCTFSKHP